MPDSALIVPINPGEMIDLSRGVTAWIEIAKDLTAGCTADQAVNKWNTAAGGASYDYRVEGKGDVTLAPLRPGHVCQ
jgi:hypothetical protein